MSTSALRTAPRQVLLLLLLALPVLLVATPAAAAGAPGPRTAAHALPAQALPATAATALTATTQAVPAPAVPAPAVPAPAVPAPGADAGSLTVDLDGGPDAPNRAIVVVLLMTVMSIAPALLILTTSFTRIIIVLSLTRNALGVQAIPPNQVLVGLSLFLSLFIMGPTLDQMNDQALQPFLAGKIGYDVAYERASVPLKDFMLEEVKEEELALFIETVGDERPGDPTDVSMTALVPAFVLSEIKTAFIIGFIIFIPFLVIDIVVSSSLMSMGMMMLPPVLISLPFKLLLFVMVDGWALLVRALLSSYAPS
jgi:flagellar biosynthetic protein FliP